MGARRFIQARLEPSPGVWRAFVVLGKVRRRKGIQEGKDGRGQGAECLPRTVPTRPACSSPHPPPAAPHLTPAWAALRAGPASRFQRRPPAAPTCPCRLPPAACPSLGHRGRLGHRWQRRSARLPFPKAGLPGVWEVERLLERKSFRQSRRSGPRPRPPRLISACAALWPRSRPPRPISACAAIWPRPPARHLSRGGGACGALSQSQRLAWSRTF